MKKIIKYIVFACFVLCLSFLTACNNKETSVEDIILRGSGLVDTTLTLTEGDEVTLEATLKPAEAHNKISWKIEEEGIATISDTGIVKGISAGSTNLIVSAGKVSKTIHVVVKEYIPLTAILFASEELEIETGIRKQLEFTTQPENATIKSLVFSVSPENEGVKVSSSGTIEVENGIEGGKEYIVTAKGFKEENVTASIKLIISTYIIEDIKLVENDFYTEIEEIVVPLDEPYRVIFPMVEPEKALAPEDKLEVEWSSDNPEVCTVNEKGRLSFHKEGIANITMSSHGINKVVKVTVTPPKGDFIEEYHIPQAYIDAIKGITAPSDLGWATLADFRSGGTASEDAKKFVFEKYKYATGPSSWFAGGGYCVEMGGWDNIHSGLEDDDLEGGGYANLFMWTKVVFQENAKKLRAHFQYRETDATFKYKLRFTCIDPITKEVIHLSDWQMNEFKTDSNLAAGETYIESDIPQNLLGKTLLLLLEYDDIDYPTDGILNGVESVNIKYFTVLNHDGTEIENALWVIGDSIMTEDFTGSMVADIARESGYTLFRDTISGSTIAPASSIGMVDHIDSGMYERNFAAFGGPKVIVIQRGSNDLFWSSQVGNSLKLGDVNSKDKTTTYGAIRYVLDYFTTTYPEAKIIWSNVLYRSDVEQSKIEEYNQNLATICSKYSNVEVYDLYSLSGIDATTEARLLIDGIHPSNSGKQVLKNLWVAKLKEE